jgi:hypothetical protein
VDRIAPSEHIENQIEQLLIEGNDDPDRLALVGRLIGLQTRRPPMVASREGHHPAVPFS